jgi:hypothetical protein
MSDQATSLPVRSEADGADERLQTKIVDATNPATQQMEVDTDSNAHVEVHGNRADDAADVALELSEQGKPNGRGDYEADDNSEPNSAGLVAGIRSANNLATDQTEHLTSIEDGGGTVRALDISLHDENGEAYSGTNPLAVTLEASEGSEICDYDTAAAVVKDATDNHDYTVSGAVSFVGQRIWASASGKMKIEVQLETAAASGIFNTFAVAFNSTSNPNIDMPLDKICGAQVTGAIIRIIRTNLDNQAQDLYSTIMGIEA